MKPYIKSILVILICATLISIRSSNAKLGKVIIDTDVGGDDAVAILLALQAVNTTGNEDLDVIAITCTYGNTYEKNVEQNVLKTLTIANRSDIPVYAGAQRPLLYNYTLNDWFGTDGFGDFNFTENIIGSVNKSKHAALALIDLVKQYPGEITLINMGPLTNIGIALALEPLFLTYLKDHYILGSSVSGVGNKQPNVEYNFYYDPESNSAILNAEKLKPTIIFPWETALWNTVSLDWRLNVLGKKDSRIMRFINQVEGLILNKLPDWAVPDAMVVAVVLWPCLTTKYIETNMNAVTEGLARGSVVVDYANITGKAANVKVLQDFNTFIFQELLLEML